MFVTPDDITTLVIDWYADENTDLRRVAQTYCGIVTLFNPLQPENAEDPIFVTLSGIVKPVSPLQSSNAHFPILDTPSGIVTLFSPLQ